MILKISTSTTIRRHRPQMPTTTQLRQGTTLMHPVRKGHTHRKHLAVVILPTLSPLRRQVVTKVFWYFFHCVYYILASKRISNTNSENPSIL